MHRLQLVAAVGFALAIPAWAGKSATAAPVRGGSVVVSSLPAARQRMKHDQAEVVRLQREVARQESDSQRASRRLQQQDRQIAELHRELSPRPDNPTAGYP